jgi:hypothetical protein
MRLRGDYFTGEKALALFTHRWDRIQATIPVIASAYPGSWYDYSTPKFRWRSLRWEKDFQGTVRGFLFPEIYRPSGGKAPVLGPERARAESVSWDRAYTRARFPETLCEIRDSGTMLRDFEECPGLWRLAAVWDELWGGRLVGVGLAATKGR